MNPTGVLAAFVLAVFAPQGTSVVDDGETCTSDRYRAVLASLREESVRHHDLAIDSLDIVEAGEADGFLRARVTNRSGNETAICVDLRSEPGFWFRRNWQAQSSLGLVEGENNIEVPFQVFRRTPETRLRVRFTGCSDDSEAFFERWIEIGRGCDKSRNPFQAFRIVTSEHFDLYAWRPSEAEADAERILETREAGLRQIVAMLGVSPNQRIRLVFYPDEETKLADTGHRGAGWAFERTIVEVYNDEIQLDPYHELTHVVAAELGRPPALLEEGLATWISERLGADALRFLGAPGKTVDQRVCDLRKEDRLIPLDDLLSFAEIGSEGSDPPVAYPQSASVVKFLVDRDGIESVRQAYRQMASPTDDATVAHNRRVWQASFGNSIEHVEVEWWSHLDCAS